MRRIIDFIKRPHFPVFLLAALRHVSPAVARFVKYGRYNPNTESYWSKKYQSGDYLKLEDQKYRALREEVMNLVPEKSQVLDAGCGTGKFMEMLKNYKGCECLGLDISEESVKMVRSKGFQAFQCDLPQIPATVGQEGFDVCTMIETLEHISEPVETIESLFRFIKKDGHIIVAVPDDCMKPDEFYEHVSSFDIQSLHGLLSRCFEIDSRLSVESDGHKYLIMRGRKVSFAQG